MTVAGEVEQMQGGGGEEREDRRKKRKIAAPAAERTSTGTEITTVFGSDVDDRAMSLSLAEGKSFTLPSHYSYHSSLIVCHG